VQQSSFSSLDQQQFDHPSESKLSVIIMIGPALLQCAPVSNRQRWLRAAARAHPAQRFQQLGKALGNGIAVHVFLQPDLISADALEQRLRLRESNRRAGDAGALRGSMPLREATLNR
jgi:hypothetical protein